MTNLATFAPSGVCATAQPDGSSLVYSAMPGLPLGLRPGDRVLHYDGRPWPELYRQMLHEELPLAAVARYRLELVLARVRDGCADELGSILGRQYRSFKHRLGTLDVSPRRFRDEMLNVHRFICPPADAAGENLGGYRA